MKIGVLYSKPFENLLPLTYILHGGRESLLDNPWVPGSQIENFEIEFRGHNFYFATKISDLSDCNKKILWVNLNEFNRIKTYKDVVDTILCFSMDESLISLEHDVNAILQIPHCFFIAHSAVSDRVANQDKIIVDHAVTFYFFYYALGYQFLNFYQTKEKENLLGVYNNFGSGYKSERSEIINFLENQLNHPVKVYQKGDVLNYNKPYLDSIGWQRATQHSTSYTDYNQSVANLIFESNGATSMSNLLFTEKTLKAILFQKPYNFFIYLGSPDQTRWLHDRGFWFLNSDFHEDPELIHKVVDNKRPINTHFGDSTAVSAVHVFEYLIFLKDKLGTDTAVYNYLLEQHSSKIDRNIENLRFLMTCSYVDKIMNFMGL